MQDLREVMLEVVDVVGHVVAEGRRLVLPFGDHTLVPEGRRRNTGHDVKQVLVVAPPEQDEVVPGAVTVALSPHPGLLLIGRKGDRWGEL